MQDREPQWKDILMATSRQVKPPSERCVTSSQVSVYPRNTGGFDGAGERREETVRLPLVRVLSPDRPVGVARPQIQDRDGAFGQGDLRDQDAIRSPGRHVQGAVGVMHRTGSEFG